MNFKKATTLPDTWGASAHSQWFTIRLVDDMICQIVILLGKRLPMVKPYYFFLKKFLGQHWMKFSFFKTFSLFEKVSKYSLAHRSGFPGGAVGKESACYPRDCLQCRRPGFDPGVRKTPWRRKWLPTPVFLPGESQGQRSCGLQSMEMQRVRHNLVTKPQITTKE